MTTAYTETPRDNSNLRVMTQDPSSIRPLGHQAADPTIEEAISRPAPRAWINQDSSSAAVKSRAEMNPRLLEPEPPVITPQQKEEALKMWKDLLMETKHYAPAKAA